MTNVAYIRASHRETNRKLRSWLDGVRRRLDGRNRVLDRLWRAAAWIIFGVVWAVGWLTFAVTLFRDVKFTLHFMECEIGGMPPEEAREYLLGKQREYTRRLSYGSVPVKEQKRIDKTFEYLFAKYPAPAPPTEESLPNLAAERHEQIMGSVAEVKTAIDTVATNSDRMIREGAEHHSQVIGGIAEVKTVIDGIASYTDRKTREDAERERHRSKSGFEPHPVDFSPKLSDAQFALLTKHMCIYHSN